MAVFVTSSTGDTETNDDLLTAGQKWSEYYDNFSLQTENYTCSTRLWLSDFICGNKHTFGKQMPPDLAMLLAFSIETVD